MTRIATTFLLISLATPTRGQVLKPQDDKPDDATAALVGVLTRQLKDKDPKRRADAAAELGRLGPKAREATRALCETCSDGSHRAATAAIDAIEKVRPDLHRHLVAIVVDKEDARRDAAFTSLAMLKDEANPATPLIVRYIRVKAAQHVAEKTCPTAALRCLGMIAGDDPAIYNPLAALVKQYPNSTLAGECLKVLTRLADNRNEFAGKLAPHLIAALSGGNRLTAIRCLGTIGPYAKDALPQLRKFRFDGSEEVRTAASEAIRLIEER